MSAAWRWYWRRLQRTRRRLAQERALERRFPSATFEDGVRVVSPQLLELGERVLVQRNSLLHCGGLRWSDGRGRIRLGDDATVSHNCVLFGAGEIVAGARFGCGPGCMVFSSRDDYERSGGSGRGHVFAPVTFGDDVLLFAGVIVGPGVSIGSGAIVGAGSVVLNDVPAGTLSAGSPARVLRSL